ncbi:MAG: acyl-CoA dehydrogenase family protein [Reyranellaceae bacterium]
MDFELSPEQVMIQDSIRTMVEREIDPLIAKEDPDAPLPKPVVKKIVKICAPLGLTSARLPAEVGGGNVSALTFGIMREALPPVVSFICGGQETTAFRIYHGGTPEQRERYIPALVNGDKLGCTGTTEPDTGSDPRGVKTKAVFDGDHVVLNGRKAWVSNASVCDIMLVVASAGSDERGFNTLIRVVADQEDAPFTTRKTPTLGFRTGHLGEAIFDDYRVPVRNVIGDAKGGSAKVLSQTWTTQRPMMGLLAVRMAEKAMNAAVKYAGERVMFGRKIGSFQLVQELLAEISTAVTTSRLLCYYALDCVDKGKDASQLSAMAKRYSIAACQRAVSLAMEVHGAMGISTELGLEELYRDVRMLPIPDGTNQILTLIEGRAITGISALR